MAVYKKVNGVLIEIQEEDIKDNQMRFEYEEAHRPLTQAEVQEIMLKAQINTVEIADNISVRMKDYYPTFEEIVGQTVKQGFKFTYNGELYKTIQPSLMIQEIYPPMTGTESLYTRIDEEHLGNKYDPIPYSGNMALEAGKYYTQDGVMYLCNRDTVNAVYDSLSNLLAFVEVVS